MKAVKGLIKCIGAGVLSIAILCILMYFYDILPPHTENPRRNTDYVWPANSIWVKTTEGIAFGRFDANGFNNKAVVDNPDIIVLGSSHMEATEVMQNENAPYLLSIMLDGKYSVYNMGISGHHFYKVCQYLPTSLELYDTFPKAVIIETTTINLTEARVDEAISGTVNYTVSHDKGIIGALQKVTFFRALYHQIAGGLLDLFMPDSEITTSNGYDDAEMVAEEANSKTVIEEAAYEKLFSYLSEIEKKYGTQIIICYHPTEKLMEDGNIYFNSSDRYLAAFESFADKYNISFVDMTSSFEQMYYEENHVAHGFCTGLLAKGHLNKYGHAAMAGELYSEIMRLEEAGELCQ